MNRVFCLCVAVCGLAAASAPASAQKTLDPRIRAALACTAQTIDQERLRCFDAAMADLRDAAKKGSLTVGQSGPGDPTKMDGIVKAASETGFNRYWIQLDTGDRWELIGDSSNVVPRIGAQVKIRRGALGNFWLSEKNTQAFRARFLGRRTPS